MDFICLGFPHSYWRVAELGWRWLALAGVGNILYKKRFRDSVAPNMNFNYTPELSYDVLTVCMLYGTQRWVCVKISLSANANLIATDDCQERLFGSFSMRLRTLRCVSRMHATSPPLITSICVEVTHSIATDILRSLQCKGTHGDKTKHTPGKSLRIGVQHG
jgi:hypothetical protein